MTTLHDKFTDAGRNGRDFRPVPFWAWNDELDPQELRWQIRQMRKAGFGGYFMHARRGLVSSYMGKDWMDGVLTCVDEARRSGLLPWLYDEECWPSGTGGRRVIAGRPEFQTKILSYELIRPAQFRPRQSTVAVFVGRRVGHDDASFRRLKDLQAARTVALEADEILIHYSWELYEYVDVMNRAATEAFLESTHHEYGRVVGRQFGRAVPGIFTDEPLFRNLTPDMAWSLELPEFFRRMNGYDLLDHLPAMSFQPADAPKVRFDYYRTVMRLFILAYTLPIYQWCQRNKLSLTGHFMSEDTLSGQIAFNGGVMPHYEYMHIPGIDHLRRVILSPVLPKQVSSVANQFGRPRVISETWGCSGQNVSLEELRWIADWQFVNGINIICPHLTLYSMRGCRKKDFPPNLSYQQPYWPHMKLLSDTLARTSALTSQGELVADILLLHPITSAWVLGGGRDREKIKQLDHDLAATASALAGMHADFEFGDEMIMERHGRVEKGRLVINKRSYSTVVVPSSINWQASTLQLLKRFVKSGGKVIFAGRQPELIDGKTSADLKAFCAKQKQCKLSLAAGCENLRKLLKPPISIVNGRSQKQDEDIAVMWRHCGREQLFFLVNQNPDADKNLTVTLPVKGVVQQLDAATGNATPVAATAERGRSRLKLTLPAMASTLLTVDTEAKPPKVSNAAAGAAPARPRHKISLPQKWNYRRLTPNVLMMDKAHLTIGDQPQGELMHVADIDKRLLETEENTLVSLSFAFTSDIEPTRSQRLQLAIEKAQEFEVHVNGLRVPLREEGWFVDKCIRLLDISRLVSKGRNEVTLRRPYFTRPEIKPRLTGEKQNAYNFFAYPEVEFEPIYLVGDFGVRFDGQPEEAGTFLDGSHDTVRMPAHRSLWMTGSPRLTSSPTSGSGENLVVDGLPFFAGAVELSQTVMLDHAPSADALLELPQPEAIITEVVINGKQLPPIWQRPFSVRVGEHLLPGKNEITIRLTGSLRNLMGPHHVASGDPYTARPQSFEGRQTFHRGHRVQNAEYRDDYNLVPLGLPGNVTLHY